MPILLFSDILRKAGIDPAKVKLIRHSLTDANFRACYEIGKIHEYTCHQKKDFSKGYDYWITFISGSGTLAKLHSVYKAGNSLPDTRDLMPKDIPESEASKYDGTHAVFHLEKLDILKEFEGKLTIDWGRSTRMWHQKGTTEKPVVSIQPDEKKVFKGFDDLVLSYDELKDIVDNPDVYDAWHTALSSVNAIYLIVDEESGKQYIGSAYGRDGLLGRWKNYVSSRHGNNKRMKDVICLHPQQFHAFRFSILQILPKTVTDDDVIHVESRWKRKLMSIEFGMNDN